MRTMFRELDLGTYLEARACTGDTERKSGTATDMRVVALAEQLYDARDLRWVLEKQEGERDNSGTADVVRSI